MALELVNIEDILPFSEPVDRMAEREKHLGEEMEVSFNNALERWSKQVIKPHKEIIRNTIMDAQGDGKNATVDDILNNLGEFDTKVSNIITDAYSTFNQDEADMIQREVNARDIAYFKEHGHWPKPKRDIMKGVSLFDEDESNYTGKTKSVNVSELFSLDDDEDTTPAVVSHESNKVEDEKKDVGITITPDMLL